MVKWTALTAATIESLPAELSPTERQQWQALHHPTRRHTFLLSRVLRRRLLAAALNCSASDLQFELGRHGKPQLRNEGWQFNLSHSGEWLVIALCPIGPLGIDIEMGSRRRAVLPLAQRFYSPAEYEWLCTLPSMAQSCAFYRLWARKEAVLKAHSGGIGAGLAQVNFWPQQGWRFDNQLDAYPYQIQDWSIEAGWLSLAAATPVVTLYRCDANLKSTLINPMLTNTIFQESAS
jgi:4'-phosphopantetheinyl transferase